MEATGLTEEMVMGYLKELGETEKEVHDKLLKEKCFHTDTSSIGRSCPVAVYLKKKSNFVSHVSSSGVNFYSKSTMFSEYGALPDPVRDFVFSFDKGLYPELTKYGTDEE